MSTRVKPPAEQAPFPHAGGEEYRTIAPGETAQVHAMHALMPLRVRLWLGGAGYHQHTQRADELLHRVQGRLQECTVAATPAVVEAEGG